MRRVIAALALIAAVPISAEGTSPPLPPAPAAKVSLIGPVLYVVAPDRAVAFYRDGLGMQLGMTLDHGMMREYMLRFSGDLDAPGLILLHDTGPAAPAALISGNGYQRLVLRVSDLDAVAARLDAAGYAHGPIRGTTNAYRMMMASDPEGYRLELVQRGAPQ